MSRITTHILDTATGKPAAGIQVILYKLQADGWQQIASGITDKDGRIVDLHNDDQLTTACCRLKFFTSDYFVQHNMATFYPYVEIVFSITGNAHYHIPLLLSAFGYTTYRGS